MTLPAAVRRRWHVASGGALGYLDLGDAMLLVPGGIEALRHQILDNITNEEWADAAAGFGDSELATQ